MEIEGNIDLVQDLQNIKLIYLEYKMDWTNISIYVRY